MTTDEDIADIIGLKHPELAERQCRNCLFWKQRTDNQNNGQCRRNPPAPSLTGMFPWISADEWCGEYRWSGK